MASRVRVGDVVIDRHNQDAGLILGQGERAWNALFVPFDPETGNANTIMGEFEDFYPYDFAERDAETGLIPGGGRWLTGILFGKWLAAALGCT